jgi:tetratricopeptide (TPR) repeat protein
MPPPPTQATALLASAAQALASGQPALAIAPLRAATALAPGDATLHHDLGLACLQCEQPAAAITAFQAAVTIKPRYADAWFRMGIALEKLGDATGAIHAYERATDCQPSLTQAWFRAGALVFTLGHRAEAIGCFRRAAATGPKTSFGRLGAARALLAQDRDVEAEAALRHILTLEPSNTIAQDLLGHVLAESGRFDKARACFEQAIEQAPLLAGGYYDLVRCRRLTAQDAALLPRMQAALAINGLEAPQRMRVHLALGKAADDFGDYALAMRQFDAADALRRQAVPFDAIAFGAQIDRIIAYFTPARIAGLAALGQTDATPVIIVGMPRSGTTLAEQILSCHPQVAAGGELNFWNQRGRSWLQAGMPHGDAAWPRDQAAAYRGILRAIGPRATRVTDKMPFNFIWAGLIHSTFPNATIIHCNRAAIDTALSIHQTYFNPHVVFPTGGAELVAYFRAYERLIAHWRKVLPTQRFIDIDYKELTRTPQPVIRRMVAACGLAWNDACLHPERNTRVVKTPSKWQTRQPIYRHAVDRWRHYEPYLGPLSELVSPSK